MNGGACAAAVQVKCLFEQTVTMNTGLNGFVRTPYSMKSFVYALKFSSKSQIFPGTHSF